MKQESEVVCPEAHMHQVLYADTCAQAAHLGAFSASAHYQMASNFFPRQRDNSPTSGVLKESP